MTLIDTGEATLTGERLKRVSPYLKDHEDFFFTYGDGLSDVHLGNLAKFHKKHGKKASVTVIKPPGRFGAVSIQSCGKIDRFEEKPPGDGGYVNGGFFILSKEIFEFLPMENTSWESVPMLKLIGKDELMAFRHDGFWSAMDTLRDKNYLDGLWNSDKAPWKNWT